MSNTSLTSSNTKSKNIFETTFRGFDVGAGIAALYSPENKPSPVEKYGRFYNTVKDAANEEFKYKYPNSLKIIAASSDAEIISNPLNMLKYTKEKADAQLRVLNDPVRQKQYLQDSKFTLGTLNKNYNAKDAAAKFKNIEYDFQLKEALNPFRKTYVVDEIKDGKIVSFREVVPKSTAGAEKIITRKNMYSNIFDGDAKYIKNGFFENSTDGLVETRYIDAKKIPFNNAVLQSRYSLNKLETLVQNNPDVFNKNKLSYHFEINNAPGGAVGSIGLTNTYNKYSPFYIEHPNHAQFMITRKINEMANTTNRLNSLSQNIEKALPEAEMRAHFDKPWYKKTLIDRAKYMSLSKKVLSTLGVAGGFYQLYSLKNAWDRDGGTFGATSQRIIQETITSAAFAGLAGQALKGRKFGFAGVIAAGIAGSNISDTIFNGTKTA